MFSTGEASAAGYGDEIGEERRLPPDHCGILPNNCLPCLSSNAIAVEKRRPLSPDTPSSRRKSLSKLSFKWREGQGLSDMTSRECSRCVLPASEALCFCFFVFSGFTRVGYLEFRMNMKVMTTVLAYHTVLSSFYFAGCLAVLTIK